MITDLPINEYENNTLASHHHQVLTPMLLKSCILSHKLRINTIEIQFAILQRKSVQSRCSPGQSLPASLNLCSSPWSSLRGKYSVRDL